MMGLVTFIEDLKSKVTMTEENSKSEFNPLEKAEADDSKSSAFGGDFGEI